MQLDPKQPHQHQPGGTVKPTSTAITAQRNEADAGETQQTVSQPDGRGSAVEKSSLISFKDIQPSQFHPEKKWMATHFKIERPDGTVEEVESTTPLLTMQTKDGTRIEVPAFAAHHVTTLHRKGEEAGSTLGDSLEASFRAVEEHLPEKLPFAKESAAFEIDLGKTTGTEGVASQKEMLEKGIVSEADLKALATAKDEVFRLNLVGTDEDKQKFVDAFNAKPELSGRNVKLGVRGGAVAPFFITERQATTKMFVVVGKEKDPDGSEHNRIWTIAPGRYMDKLPTDGKFIGRYASEGVTEGTSVGTLWKKMNIGEPISPSERALVDEQSKAQICWWDGGFIVPPETKR